MNRSNSQPRFAAWALRLEILVLITLVPLLYCAAGEPDEEKAPQRVVIPFDFESTFDDGRYGRTMGDMIWKKLEREGGFVIPESMQDVRAYSERKKVNPNPATPLAQLQKIVRDDFGGDIAIWGKIERVAGNAEDVYDLTILIADFSVKPPRSIHEVKARTETVSEIPHIHIKQALNALYGRADDAPKLAKDPAAEKRWRDGPNLVQGDFERGRDAPPGWDPLPRYVRWQTEPNSDRTGKENRFVQFDFPGSVAETSGVLLYSEYFPIDEGATYRFQCRWRTSGSAVKVFIKCYDESETKFSKSSGSEKKEASGSTPLPRTKSRSRERREVYRSQQNLTGPAQTWNTHTEDFTPSHTQFSPRWGRVMLYAYYPAGTVDWDDVCLKQIRPPPETKKK
jgi:hypothetical protein